MKAGPIAAGGGLASRHAPPLDLPVRFFATALVALGLVVILSPWQTSLLLGSFYDPRLLVLVHLNTLAVIAATIMGASYQLLPVVLQVPLASVRMARLTLWLLVPGIAAFTLGLTFGVLPVLGLGGTLLVASLWLYASVVLRTLASAPSRDVIFWHLAVAVVGLVSAAGLGALLAFTKPGGLLGGLTFAVLAAHATLMLGGWVTPMLTGVAYRLIGMFTLSEDHLLAPLAWAELACTAAGAWLLAVGALLAAPVLQIAGASSLLLGMLCFAVQVARLYRHRRRRTFDIHMPFATVAIMSGLLATGCVLFGLLTGAAATDAVWRLAGWLAIAGWAQTAIQGFLYKIGTFLTWLHRYAPLAGRQRVPTLEALYSRHIALAGWAAWTAGLAFESLAILTGSLLVAHLAALVLSLGLAALLLNAGYVGAHWRSRSRPATQPAPRRQEPIPPPRSRSSA